MLFGYALATQEKCSHELKKYILCELFLVQDSIIQIRWTVCCGWKRRSQTATGNGSTKTCFQQGKKPKIPIILVFVFLKQDSHMLFDFLKLVKPVYAVTSIEWSPVFKSHIFVICHRIFHMNLATFLCPNGDLLIHGWMQLILQALLQLRGHPLPNSNMLQHIALIFEMGFTLPFLFLFLQPFGIKT